MNVDSIIGFVGGSCKGDSSEQDVWREEPVGSCIIKEKINSHIKTLFDFVDKRNDRRTFNEVERGLYKLMFTLARLFLAFFLTRREENSQGEVRRWTRKGFRKRKRERKYLNTIFGQVCFWRMYVRRPGANGLHPLDLALRLTADGFSLWCMEMSARLSTLMPYEQVTGLLMYLFTWSPSKTTVEKAVLGFGRYTQEWFKSAPAPEGDGEILVTQIDGKATPTATEEELEKRRGKRPPIEERPLSPRHRGRTKRKRRGSKKRKAPGDKSKNGKAATIVIQYTLKMARDKDGKPVLLGPINKKFYASYASKSHAFTIARREADKRGFTRESGKRHQIVTDGDEDFARLAEDLFPEAIHTLDIMHVLEYVWEAGRFLYKAGSKKLASWVKKQENLLYKGKALLVVQHICDIRDNVGKKASERLETIRMYLQKRLHMMLYDELRQEDLEVASGVVEGGVKHVIGKRFDNGSMRWIRERAEALLQLRCIEMNGDWESFVHFVERELSMKGKAAECPARLLTTVPDQLPTFGVGA